MLRNDLTNEVTVDVLCVAKARFEEPEKLKLRFEKTQADIWEKIPELKKPEDQEKAEYDYFEMNKLVDSIVEIKGKIEGVNSRLEGQGKRESILNTSAWSVANGSSSSSGTKPKLPSIEVTCFNENIRDFVEFKNLYLKI